MAFFRRLQRLRAQSPLAIIGGSCVGIVSSISLVHAAGIYSSPNEQQTGYYKPSTESIKTVTNKLNTNNPPLKTYSINEVSQHNSIENRMWISFKDGVYDITEYIQKHVGGPKYIELVAGGRLEPFWGAFHFHLKDNDTAKLLESYRIGNLKEEDQIDLKQYLSQFEFANEPFEQRDYSKIDIMRDCPLLSEPKNQLLADNYYTPNDIFYIRNHFPVPYDLAADNYKLDIFLNTGNDINFMDMNDKFAFDPGC